MDRRVINLNAFGEEVIPKGGQEFFFSSDPDDEYFRSEERPFKKNKPEIKNSRSESKENQYQTVFRNILKNMSQAKLLHWQTPKYSQHKALDELFESLVDLGDELAESIMGKYGRPRLSGENLSIDLFNYDNNLSSFMDHLYSCYKEDCRSLFDEKRDTELINLIDEILSMIDKIKYLLTLE